MHHPEIPVKGFLGIRLNIYFRLPLDKCLRGGLNAGMARKHQTYADYLAAYASRRRKIHAMRRRGWTFARIGDAMGITRQRVGQLLAKSDP